MEDSGAPAIESPPVTHLSLPIERCGSWIREQTDQEGVVMKRPRLAVTVMDKPIADLADSINHRILAIWAADCAERVLPFFESVSPEDDRPRRAIEAVRSWARTGVFRMADVRKASLAAHAAAREVEEDDAARSAGRSAGQAVATARVPRHAVAAAVYAATAVRYAANPSDADSAILEERSWQYKHLIELADRIGASRRGKK